MKPSISDHNAAEWSWARCLCHRLDPETEMEVDFIGLGAGFDAFLFLIIPFALEMCEDIGEMSA